jgi:mono/diheme cytochrome c family protein
MRSIRFVALVLVSLALVLSQSLVTGDAQRGAALFKSQNCVACHNVNGQGGKSAPDLGAITGRAYTPADMASLMWNHAPVMWSAMAKQNITRPTLSEQQAADLFAYFYAARYFDKPGDAGRGKRVFAAKHCANCHGLSTAATEGIKPVIAWQSLDDPVLLAQQMWNHGAEMRAAFQSKGIKWPEINSIEMNDLLVYLRNLPEVKAHPVASASSPAAADGPSLFQSKGCAGCHVGKLSLENRYIGATLTDFAVAMWNHEPRMKQPPPPLHDGEMQAIVAYLQTVNLFNVKGNADRGKKVFAAKKCAVCHGNASSGAPNLSSLKGKFQPYFMVSALWEHGPAMEEKMRQEDLVWPRFVGSEMSDLLAYLNSK